VRSAHRLPHHRVPHLLPKKHHPLRQRRGWLLFKSSSYLRRQFGEVDRIRAICWIAPQRVGDRCVLEYGLPVLGVIVPPRRYLLHWVLRTESEKWDRKTCRYLVNARGRRNICGTTTSINEHLTTLQVKGVLRNAPYPQAEPLAVRSDWSSLTDQGSLPSRANLLGRQVRWSPRSRRYKRSGRMSLWITNGSTRAQGCTWSGVSSSTRRRATSALMRLVTLLALTPSSGHLTRENVYYGKITSGVHS
jgi:hypothetical protein